MFVSGFFVRCGMECCFFTYCICIEWGPILSVSVHADWQIVRFCRIMQQLLYFCSHNIQLPISKTQQRRFTPSDKWKFKMCTGKRFLCLYIILHNNCIRNWCSIVPRVKRKIQLIRIYCFRPKQNTAYTAAEVLYCTWTLIGAFKNTWK